MLSMHSQLMKRYEKEVKQNMTHIETIANLNVSDMSKRTKKIQLRIVNMFLPIIFIICFGCSEEPSH